MISVDYNKSYEDGRKMLDERYKTCGMCVHDGEGDQNISGSTCYLCKRNPEDHRIDWFEENKEVKENE